MLGYVSLAAQRLTEHISSRIIGAKSVRYRPFHHRPYTLPYPPVRFRLFCAKLGPKRLKYPLS